MYACACTSDRPPPGQPLLHGTMQETLAKLWPLSRACTCLQYIRTGRQVDEHAVRKPAGYHLGYYALLVVPAVSPLGCPFELALLIMCIHLHLELPEVRGCSCFGAMSVMYVKAAFCIYG